MRSVQVFVALLLLVAAAAIAQEHPTVAAQQNTIYVGADGKFEAVPDTAQIQFSVSVQDDTSQVAFQRASKKCGAGQGSASRERNRPQGRDFWILVGATRL